MKGNPYFLEFVACKVVLVCTPISHLVGKITPNDAILVKWQFEHANTVIEMFDSLVGYNHAKDEEE